MPSFCLGQFAATIAKTPPANWKGELAKVAEVCTKGCGKECRAVCREYAATQWRCVKGAKK